MHRIKIALILSLSTTGILLALPSGTSLEQAEDALKDRDYPRAISLLEKAHAKEKAGKDRILYLLATANQHAKRYDKGIAACDQLLLEHPGSAWSDKAWFKKGDLLALKKEDELAARLYEARVAATASPERRKPLAMIYVKAARTFLHPKEKDDPSFKPNHVAAHRLLQKALELNALGDDEEAVRFEVITCEEKGRFNRNKLLASCDLFLKTFAKSDRTPSVRLTRGSAFKQLNRTWEAVLAWQTMVNEHPKSPEAPKALRAIADAEPGPRGIKALRLLVKSYPKSPEAAPAAYALAIRLSRHEDLREEAILACRHLVQTWPKEKEAPSALIQIAILQRAGGKLDPAIGTFEEFLKAYPENPRWGEVRQQISNIRYTKAHNDFLREKFDPARKGFAAFLSTYPTDNRARKIGLLLGTMFEKEKKWNAAIEQYRRVAQRYPRYAEARQAHIAAAKILEKEKKFDDAIREYGKARAGTEITRLRAEALLIRSDRVFPTTVPATVTLTARNLKKIQFRLWALDLKDYFEKRGSTAGLHAIEVGVIAPDHEWEHEIKDHRKYEQFEVPVSLPAKGSGAYIVTARGGQREATTVVLVSDLAFVAKIGHRGATLFGQDMRRNEPLKTVPFRTAVNGKIVKEKKDPLPGNKVSLLAEVLGNFAFQNFDISRIHRESKRGPVALLLPDRARYAKTDTVVLRILVRDAKNNQWIVPGNDKTYTLIGKAQNGKILLKKKLSLSPRGTTTEEFPVFPGINQLHFSVEKRDRGVAKSIGQVHVSIAPVAPRTAHIQFLLEEKTWFYGDDVPVSILLRDRTGRPLAHRDFRWRVAGDPKWQEGMTGKRGEFRTTISHTERFEGKGCFIEANYNTLYDSKPIVLLRRGFRLEMDPATRSREVVLTGESKTVHIRMKDFAGNPASPKLTWQVTRKDKAGMPVAVAEGSLASKGKGSFSFTPTQGGIHMIVIRGRQEDGTPVRIQTAVSVSDEKDKTLLRILSNRDEFAPQNPVSLTIHSRAKQGPAYVIVENEKIEWSRPITLSKGKNPIEIDLKGKRLRNFRVSVVMMLEDRFHSAIRDFTMPEAEKLEITTDKDTYRPGSDVTVTINGPRKSEIWIQVSEELSNHLNRNAINPRRPGPYFSTSASNTTRFTGVSAQIDRELENALATLRDMNNDGVYVMMENEPSKAPGKPLEEEKKMDKWRGKHSGESQLGARYGGGAGRKMLKHFPTAQATPFLLASKKSDGKGRATFTFRLPLRNAKIHIRAYAIDSSNAISHAAVERTSFSSLEVALHTPEAIRAGDRANASVFVTNHSGAAVKTELGTVPAHAVAEFSVPLKPVFSVTVDGRKYERTIPVLPARPENIEVGSGSTFEIGPENGNPISLSVDVASATRDRIRILAKGTTPFLETADLATAVLAHALAGSPEAKRLARELEFAPDTGDIPSEVLRFIALAKTAGKTKPSPARLKSYFSRTPYDGQKAILLFALSHTDSAPFAYVKRLQRNADSLSPRTRAIVAILLGKEGRTDEAKSMLHSIKGTATEKLPYSDWSNSEGTTRAFLALAGGKADLENHPPVNAFERAVYAMALSESKHARKKIVLRVNGKKCNPGQIDPELLVPGPQKIEARGGYALARFHYTGKARPGSLKIKATRTNRWPDLIVDGNKVTRTLSVGMGKEEEAPSMKTTSAGSLSSTRISYTITGGENRLYLLREPFPTGLEILSVKTWGAMKYRVRPEGITLLINKKEGEMKAGIEITWRAASTGTYAGAPLQVTSPGQPGRAHSDETGSFTVIPAGEDFRKGLPLRQGERFQLGTLHYNAKRWKKAQEVLAPLFEETLLRDPYYVNAARMLTYIGVELNNHEQIVRYFEILKEKLPNEVVPFDKILAVGHAYLGLKEYDRALQVFRGTSDAYFLQEANLVEEMERLGRTGEEVKIMRRLIRSHPDTALNREMQLGFGQDLLNRAKAMKAGPETRPERLSKKEMLEHAAEEMEEYLALHPGDSACDEASLALGTTRLEAHQYAEAEKSGRASARRYPKSRFLDTFDYIQAFALFAQKKFPEALKMCKRIETFDYGAEANPGPEVMRNLAILMKAQIHHAKGELDKALASYRRVRERYPDAARALAFLEREAIALPEVTVVPEGEPDRIEIEYSGVAKAQVKAYKVNLTMLYLKHRGVKDSSAIEVAGIRPVFEKTFTLRHGNTKRREKEKLALDLKETGAYLVSVKAGDFFATGLFLKSNLSMAVQEESPSGTVRVNVTTAPDGKFEENVKVTYIGSGDKGFKSAKTDLRGIAEVKGVKGYAMVIAEKNNHYAFHRGLTPLSGFVPRNTNNFQQGEEKDADALNDKLKSLEKNWKGYRMNRQQKQEGVEIERTKK